MQALDRIFSFSLIAQLVPYFSVNKIEFIHSLWHHVHRDDDVTLCHDQMQRDIIDRDSHSRIRIIVFDGLQRMESKP
jgi:hypothetical protein